MTPITEGDYAMFVLPKDLQDSAGSSPFRGIKVDPFLTAYSGSWQTEAVAAYRIYTRVRSWALTGTLRYYGSASTDDYFEGPLTVTIRAVDIEDHTLTDESKLSLHHGWYGTAETEGWTYTFINAEEEPETVEWDAGPITVRLWPALGGTDGTDGMLIFWSDPTAHMQFDPSGNGNIHFGARWPSDACELSCTMPITYDGTFDGTELTDFSVNLGSPDGIGSIAFGKVEGSLELTPTFWGYDDGDGLYYNTTTGKWLRTPRLFDPGLIN